MKKNVFRVSFFTKAHLISTEKTVKKRNKVIKSKGENAYIFQCHFAIPTNTTSIKITIYVIIILYNSVYFFLFSEASLITSHPIKIHLKDITLLNLLLAY